MAQVQHLASRQCVKLTHGGGYGLVSLSCRQIGGGPTAIPNGVAKIAVPSTGAPDLYVKNKKYNSKNINQNFLPETFVDAVARVRAPGDRSTPATVRLRRDAHSCERGPIHRAGPANAGDSPLQSQLFCRTKEILTQGLETIGH